MKKKDRSPSEAKTLPSVARQQLSLLSRVLEEVNRHYLNRLQREIQRQARAIEHVEKEGEFTRKQLRDLSHLIKQLESLHIKTERGRRKDLKKIDALIGELEKVTENW